MSEAERRLTVLQFGLSYAPKWRGGGPPRIMYDYARHLIDAGFRVMVLTPDSNRPAPEDNWTGFPPGLEVHYCRKQGGWRGQFYFDYSWDELTGFFDAHWKEIDFVHLYQSRSLFNIVALWAAQKYGLKVVLSSFGSMPRRGSLGKLFYDQIFVFPLSRRTELLLAQTRHECETYARYGGRPDHIHLLPLAVDLATRPAMTVDIRRTFRARYAIPETAWLFLFLGRIHPTKGVEFLVDCFARMASATPEAHLALVGHDEGSAVAVQAAVHAHGLEARVTFCGPLFDIQRWQAYAAADCFVILPEIFEETSLASLEALACGTPVITNQRADVPWLEEYGAGRVVPGGDVGATVAALQEAHQADTAARRRAAVQLVAEKFEISAVTGQYAGLLRATAKSFADVLMGPLLIGPLPGTIGTSGQAACFKMLVDGLGQRRHGGPVVNLGSSEAVNLKGRPTLARAIEYVSIFAKVTRHCLSRTRVVYLTMAQSRHGFFRDAVIIALARLTGNQVVLHLHGGNYAHYYDSEPAAIRAVIRFTLRRARSIIVLAEKLRSCFAFDAQLAPKLCVVRNSLALGDTPSTPPVRVTGPDAELTLLFLSNLIESKGYLEVLEVLALLRDQEGLRARAVFCGNFLANPSDDVRIHDTHQARQYFERRAMELGVTENIAYRGSVGGAAKERILTESHFLIFPTRYDNEGQPLVLIEALACGLPAITTDYRANGEMVLDGQTGFLVDWREPAVMARKIAALWRQPGDYARMSANCRRHFEAQFTPGAHIASMENILFANAS